MSAAAASLRCSGAVRCERGGIEKSSVAGMECTIPLSLRDGSGGRAVLPAFPYRGERGCVAAARISAQRVRQKTGFAEGRRPDGAMQTVIFSNGMLATNTIAPKPMKK